MGEKLGLQRRNMFRKGRCAVEGNPKKSCLHDKNDDAAATMHGIGRENARHFFMPLLASVTSVGKIPDREWVQSNRRAENLGIRKEEDQLRLDSCIKIR